MSNATQTLLDPAAVDLERPPPGDRDRLIEDHAWLVKRTARRLLRPGIDIDDLEDVGQLALVEAADRSDLERGIPFEAFASMRVKGAMLKFIAEQRHPIRVPANLAWASRSPAAAAHIRPERLAAARAAQAPVLRPSGEDGFSLADLVIDRHTAVDGLLDEEVPEREIVAALHRALSELPDREAQHMRHLHGIDDTPELDLDEAAAELRMSRSGADKMKRRAEDKLKGKLSSLLGRKDETTSAATNGRLTGDGFIPGGTDTVAKKYIGVERTKSGRWQAKITCNGHTKCLGTYDTQEQAARAYDGEARNAPGSPRRLNFPDKQPGPAGKPKPSAMATDPAPARSPTVAATRSTPPLPSPGPLMAEIEAMRRVAEVLDALDPKVAARVVAWFTTATAINAPGV